MSETTDYYASDPDWTAYARRNGIEYGTNLNDSPPPLDMAAGRANQVIEEREWAQNHTLEAIRYQSQIQHVTVRDGHTIEIKVSWPMGSSPDTGLPLLFVTHGGGFIQGTHTTEEAWLLWPLLTRFKVLVVSVAYRLAPEAVYPTYINDCWDVLLAVMGRGSFELVVPFDHDKVVLCGSSAGAAIAASLSQKTKDAGVAVRAVVLNVPVTCDYRHWPAGRDNASYRESEAALLSSSVMRQVWDIAVPEGAGANALASPLLGISKGLPPHFVYVAGQDPLRDEGIEYARLLKEHGNQVELYVYPGVPHTFGEMWELKATQKFWADMVRDLETIL